MAYQQASRPATPVAAQRQRAKRTVPRRPSAQIHKAKASESWLDAARKSKLQEYKFASIDPHSSVRLLTFGALPNTVPRDKDDIYVSMNVVSFDDLGKTVPFEALSYHWGDDPAEYPIYFLDPGGEDRQLRDFANVVTHAMASKRRSGILEDEAERGVAKLKYKRLYVRPSLYHALKQFRQQSTNGEVFNLWVDAICIDQENEEEKRILLSHMPEIYSRAVNVCIWLGEGDNQTDDAMKFITELLEARDPKDLMKGISHAYKWNNLVSLMTKGWFSRRWVIQELALATNATVYCGSKEVHWDDFRDAISLLGLHVDAIRDLFKLSPDFDQNFWAIGDIDLFGATVLVDVIPNIFKKSGSKSRQVPALGLETLVSTYTMFDSADPRDTVIAMRNIAKETVAGSPHKSRIEPPGMDYKKNLYEVYSEFIEWVIKSSKSLDILCRHWARPERGEHDSKPPQYPQLVTLPSWILETPKLSMQNSQYQRRLRGDSFVGLPGFSSYNASDGMKPVVSFGQRDGSATHKGANGHDFEIIDHELRQTARRIMIGPQMSARDILFGTNGKEIGNKHLYVEGLRMDKITWRSDPIADGVIPGSGLQKCGWNSDSYDTNEGEANEGEQIDKVLRTLTADRGADGRNTPTLYYRACEICLNLLTINGHLNTRDLLRAEQPEFVKRFLKRVQAVTWDRVFLETSSDSSSLESPIDGLGHSFSEQNMAEKLVGLGPQDTHKGDIVCILFGCSVPVILREVVRREGESAFKFIGEAFIYGKMDGEAISMLSPHELESRKETFKLI